MDLYGVCYESCPSGHPFRLGIIHLKTESRHGADFVVTGGTDGCNNENWISVTTKLAS